MTTNLKHGDSWYTVSIIDATTDDDEKVTWYRVIVDSPNNLFQTYELSKRFSEFAKLHSSLKKLFRNKVLPAFPSKTLRKKLTPEFVEKRKKLLEKYCESLLVQPCVRVSEFSIEFFGLTKKEGRVDPDLFRWKVSQFGSLVKKKGVFSLSSWMVRELICLSHATNEVYAAAYELKNRSIGKKTGDSLMLGHLAIWLQRRKSPDVEYLWNQDYAAKLTAVIQDPRSRSVYFALGDGLLQKISFKNGYKPGKCDRISTRHEMDISHLLFHRNYLFASSLDKTISFYDTDKNDQCVGRLNINHAVLALRTTGESLFIGTAKFQRSLLEYDLEGLGTNKGLPKLKKDHSGGRFALQCLTINHDEGKIYCAGSENVVFEWCREEKTGEVSHGEAWPCIARNSKLTAIAVCPDIGCICTGGDSGWIGILEVSSRKWVHVFRPHKSDITTLIWRNEKNLAGGYDSGIYTSSTDGSCHYFSIIPPHHKRLGRSRSSLSKAEEKLHTDWLVGNPTTTNSLPHQLLYSRPEMKHGNSFDSEVSENLLVSQLPTRPIEVRSSKECKTSTMLRAFEPDPSELPAKPRSKSMSVFF